MPPRGEIEKMLWRRESFGVRSILLSKTDTFHAIYIPVYDLSILRDEERGKRGSREGLYTGLYEEGKGLR